MRRRSCPAEGRGRARLPGQTSIAAGGAARILGCHSIAAARAVVRAATFPPVGLCRILLPKCRSAWPWRLRVDVFQEAEMLRKVPFFGGLDPAKLKLLAFTSRALRFGPGEDLMRPGRSGRQRLRHHRGRSGNHRQDARRRVRHRRAGQQRADRRDGRHHECAARHDGPRERGGAGAAHRRRRLPAPADRQSRLRAARDAGPERARERGQCPPRRRIARSGVAEAAAARREGTVASGGAPA